MKTERVKAVDAGSKTATATISTNFAIEMQSFCARVINLCHDVHDANSLTDIKSLKAAARTLNLEALGVSKIYELPR